MLGFDIGGSGAIDGLFDTFDADASGSVDFEELHQLLRKAFEPNNLNGEEDEARDHAAQKLQAIQRGNSERKRINQKRKAVPVDDA